MELSYPQSPLRPCYKRKAFLIDGYLLTFDFGEFPIGSLEGTAAAFLYVTYVVHHQNKQGSFTGCSYGGYSAHRVVTLTEGEQLFAAANETGAAAFLADRLKLQNYSQTKELLSMLGRWLSRLPLHWLWQMRKWKRQKF